MIFCSVTLCFSLALPSIAVSWAARCRLPCCQSVALSFILLKV